jgi:hypothetical protein
MDCDRFDTLARSLTSTGSRRRALAAILGGSWRLLGWHGGEDAAAHNPLKSCKKKSGKQKKTCVKKAKRHNATHATPAIAPPPPCQNGVKDGTESDVDCGGTCPRCALNKTCSSRDDCATALCSGQTCVACASRFECGTGATGGDCFCSSVVGGGPKVCHEGDSTGGVSRCDACPAGTVCVLEPISDNLICYKRCGAA